MREIFTYGSVGGAPGNRCFYLEADPKQRGFSYELRGLSKFTATNYLGRLNCLGLLIAAVRQ